MARRILLHPGFHKTGTSSMQHFLWVNRAALAPHAHVMLLRHVQAVAKACMYFSTTLNPLALTDLVELMDAALAAHPPGEGQDIVLSCEGLSGHLPGWPKVESYAVAPLTASYLAGYFAERFPDAEVMLVYTTRGADAWLDSVWRHHLMSHRLVEDREAFVARLRPAADLTQVAAEVAEALAPVQVYTLPIEEATAHPQGPGGALLELLDLPDALRERLQVVAEANRGPTAALAAELLALNRSALKDDQVKARKAEIATRAGLGGWVIR